MNFAIHLSGRKSGSFDSDKAPLIHISILNWNDDSRLIFNYLRPLSTEARHAGLECCCCSDLTLSSRWRHVNSGGGGPDLDPDGNVWSSCKIFQSVPRAVRVCVLHVVSWNKSKWFLPAILLVKCGMDFPLRRCGPYNCTMSCVSITVFWQNESDISKIVIYLR